MNLDALNKISYGLSVVCSKDRDKMNGQKTNTLFIATAELLPEVISINKNDLTYDYTDKSKIFTVSILSKEATLEPIGNFSFKIGRDIDKFKKVKTNLSVLGSQIMLDYTTPYLKAEVIDKVNAGTHTNFVGEVNNTNIISYGKPLIYEYYQKIKGGRKI